MESRTIHRSGTPLQGLWRDGHGAPLIVVPGALADAQAFAPVVEAMNLPEPVLIVNRRGRGSSGEQGEDYDLEVEVEDLLAWMTALESPVRLMGWSYGANIVLEAAARAGVNSPVAYEPGLGPLGLSALPRLWDASPAQRVEIVNREISQASAEALEELRASAEWPRLVRLAEPVPGELQAMNAFDPGTGWAEVEAKLILGELNRKGTLYGEAFERAARRLPQSTTTILKGQGHLAHAADPVALGRLVASLLPR